MEIILPKASRKILNDPKALEEFSILQNLLDALQDKAIPDEAISKINAETKRAEACDTTGRDLRSCIREAKNNVLKISTKELRMFPRNYHRKMWLVLGMGVFGLPIGTALGIGTGNFGLLGFGLPLGLALGYVFGTYLDKKISHQNNVLDVETY